MKILIKQIRTDLFPMEIATLLVDCEVTFVASDFDDEGEVRMLVTIENILTAIEEKYGRSVSNEAARIFEEEYDSKTPNVSFSVHPDSCQLVAA